MPLTRQLKQSLRRKLALLRRDRPAVLGFLVHGLFRDQAEVARHHCAPQQAITLEHMRRFIEHFLAAGYGFLSPEQPLGELDPEACYLFLTFDDGYGNNLRILPLLEEYAIPATCYVTTGNLEQQHCFWWDVVYRERHRRGAARADISRELKMLKQRDHPQIIAYLEEQFGAGCLQPWSDADRPMTIEELKAFASHPLGFVGNHTRDHYLLDRYPREVIDDQIRQAQKDLHNWLGVTPNSIAYPNGSYSTQAEQAARDAGLKFGLTLEKRKNPLPLTPASNDALHLGRFTLWGRGDIEAQCEVFRSDIRL